MGRLIDTLKRYVQKDTYHWRFGGFLCTKAVGCII